MKSENQHSNGFRQISGTEGFTVHRDSICPCGSGKKVRKCCQKKKKGTEQT